MLLCRKLDLCARTLDFTYAQTPSWLQRAEARTGVFSVWCVTVGHPSLTLVAPFDLEELMLYYALVFLLIALVAGFLGFGGIAFAAAGIAKLLFYIFVVLFLVSIVMHLSRGGART